MGLIVRLGAVFMMVIFTSFTYSSFVDGAILDIMFGVAMIIVYTIDAITAYRDEEMRYYAAMINTALNAMVIAILSSLGIVIVHLVTGEFLISLLVLVWIGLICFKYHEFYNLLHTYKRNHQTKVTV